MNMKQTHRLYITSGVLNFAVNEDAEFSVFVEESHLYLEIQGWETHKYMAPVFLLEDVERRGYVLYGEAEAAIQRLAESGARVLASITASIGTDMNRLARGGDSEWLKRPEALIWEIVETVVPDDLQLPIFALMRRYRHYFDDETLVIKRRTL